MEREFLLNRITGELEQAVRALNSVVTSEAQNDKIMHAALEQIAIQCSLNRIQVEELDLATHGAECLTTTQPTAFFNRGSCALSQMRLARYKFHVILWDIAFALYYTIDRFMAFRFNHFRFKHTQDSE